MKKYLFGFILLFATCLSLLGQPTPAHNPNVKVTNSVSVYTASNTNLNVLIAGGTNYIVILEPVPVILTNSIRSSITLLSAVSSDTAGTYGDSSAYNKHSFQAIGSGVSVNATLMVQLSLDNVNWYSKIEYNFTTSTNYILIVDGVFPYIRGFITNYSSGTFTLLYYGGL